MERFTGKVALVTGGGSGIGRAIATRLISDGARVIVADVSGNQDSVAAELGEQAVAWQLDVRDEASVEQLEQWIRAEYGGLDILANNAGIGQALGPLHEYPLEAFDEVMAVNARGVFLVLRSGLRLMLERGGGAVVNTASIGGFRAVPNASPYLASKGAVVMITRAAALEYADRGIRVNAVAPGSILTPMMAGASPELMRLQEELTPQRRFGTAQEIANVAVFLADDEQAGHVTGQIWVIDGGRSAG